MTFRSMEEYVDWCERHGFDDEEIGFLLTNRPPVDEEDLLREEDLACL